MEIMYNPFSLGSKTILVTGASSGIGMAVAIECSKMGARVIITGRNEERLKQTHRKLEGEQPVYIIADLASAEGVQLLSSRVEHIDGLVNCAGFTKYLPFAYATRAEFEGVFNVNFFASAELSRLLFKQKKVNKNASIVFISSVSGVYCSAPASSMYSASKGAINGLVKGMALDMAPRGIRVNCVNPGVIETNIFESGAITPEHLEVNKQQYPLGRFGKPEEVAHAVIYLLSDASAWVTGSNLLIDGGLTLL